MIFERGLEHVWKSFRLPINLSDLSLAHMIVIKGVVDRILSDDLEGSRHQRFIIKVSSGPLSGGKDRRFRGRRKDHDGGETRHNSHARTVLIAHNIDVAPRVPNLRKGGPVTIKGKYEWNELGGLMHWTHHDPDGEEDGGWIEWRGERYE